MAGRRGMLLELIRRDGGELCLVDRDELLIGRGRDCDLPLENDAVSRRHARIRRDDEGYTVEDLGSAGGTFVNNEHLGGTHRLKVGDRVKIGSANLRVLELDYIAREGEIGGPLEWYATYTCRGVACTIEIRSRTSTSHDKLQRELDAVVTRSMSEARAADDPVATVLAARDAIDRLREPIAGIDVKSQITRVLLDADALVLVREPSDAASAAWSWLRTTYRLDDLVEPAAAVVGLEYRQTDDDGAQPMPPELLAPALCSGPGVFLWIHFGWLGQLVRVTEPMRLETPTLSHSTLRTVTFDIARTKETWTLVHDGVHELLEVGTPIVFGRRAVVTPVAIQNPTDT